MAQDYTKWWNKFKRQADVAVWKRAHYYKEKYGWFRVELYEWFSDSLTDKLIEIENESYKCCQICAKHRYQVWTDWWWIEHFCIPCYTKWYFKVLRHKFIRLIKKLWKKMWLKDTQESVS